MRVGRTLNTRAPRAEEQQARPRGKGRATKLSNHCANERHGQCTSLTCRCPKCHYLITPVLDEEVEDEKPKAGKLRGITT